MAKLSALTGQLVVQTVIQEDYAYNSDVSATASVTASGFASGIGGVNFSSNFAAGTSYTRRVQFPDNNAPGDDFEIEIDIANTGIVWVDQSTYFPYTRQGTNEYGMSISAVGSNYVDVLFSGGGCIMNGATYAANGSGFSTQTTKRWHVKRSRVTARSYGAGQANLVTPGLVYQSDEIDITAQISSAQAGFACVRAVAVVTRDRNNVWRIAFNVDFIITNTTVAGLTLAFAGVSFKTGFRQSCSGGYANNSSVVPRIVTAGNTGNVNLASPSATLVDGGFVSGNVELNSKPSWA